MRSRLALGEGGQGALLGVLLAVLLVSVLRVSGIDGAPSRVEDFLAAHLEFHFLHLAVVRVLHLAHHGGGGELAVGVEGADEPLGYQVVYVCLHVGESRRRNACGDDGMVVGHLAAVEHLLALGQLLAEGGELLYHGQVFLLAEHLCLAHAVQYLRTLGIDVVREVLRVHTGIGGEFLLIQALYQLQRHVGGIAELLVAVYLQRGEVVEVGRSLAALLLAHVGHGEGLAGDGAECLLSLLLAGELARGGGKLGVAVDGGEHPVGFRLEVVDFLLPVHDEGEGGGLHASDAQHLPVLSVFQGIEARGVHAENPVADGAREAGEIERLVVCLVFQLLEALPDRLVGHRRDPQPLHGTFRLRLLHHPPLYQLSLLPGVAAVDDAVSSLHQPLYDGELLADACVVDELDAESLRNHGQGGEAPSLPHGGVVVRLLQLAKVTEGPCHLVSVTLHVSVVRGVGADDAGDVLGDAGFLCNANYHFFPVWLFVL